MRPPGEVREAARAVFREEGAATWQTVHRKVQGLEVAPSGEHARHGQQMDRGVSARIVQRTVENMARAGELRPCGQEKSAFSSNWCALYELAPQRAPRSAGDAARSLHAATSSWVRRR